MSPGDDACSNTWKCGWCWADRVLMVFMLIVAVVTAFGLTRGS